MSESNPGPRISTPCVKVCKIEPVSGICIGCRRTMAEIGAWSRLSEPQRLEIMRQLRFRPPPVLAAAEE